MDDKIAIVFDREISATTSVSRSIKLVINEPPFMFGPTEQKTLTALGCDVITTNIANDTLLVTMKSSFQNADGEVTLIYDATTEAICVDSGYISSFEITFTPMGLTPNIPSNAREYLRVTTDAVFNLIPITPVNYEAQLSNYVNANVEGAFKCIALVSTEKESKNDSVIQAAITANCVLVDLGTIIP